MPLAMLSVIVPPFDWMLTLYDPFAARPVTIAVCTPAGTVSVVPVNDAGTLTGKNTPVLPNTAPS